MVKFYRVTCVYDRIEKNENLINCPLRENDSISLSSENGGQAFLRTKSVFNFATEVKIVLGNLNVAWKLSVTQVALMKKCLKTNFVTSM